MWKREEQSRSETMPVTAIVLAGGKGTRMGSQIPKQYLPIAGKQLLWYTLRAFTESEVTDIVLVVGSGEVELRYREYVEQYGFTKISAIVEGGKERYDSVMCGLAAIPGEMDDTRVVLVHDAARACILPRTIHDVIVSAREHGACIVAVPVKDTIKVSVDGKTVSATPSRDTLWTVQTPQGFSCGLLRRAYAKMVDMRDNQPETFRQFTITDDACVVETFLQCPVFIVPGEYTNIKVTTPEDMQIAAGWLTAENKE